MSEWMERLQRIQKEGGKPAMAETSMESKSADWDNLSVEGDNFKGSTADPKPLPKKTKTKRKPENYNKKLHFLLHSEYSKWKNKSEVYLMIIKEVAKFHGINPTIKPKVFNGGS